MQGGVEEGSAPYISLIIVLLFHYLLLFSYFLIFIIIFITIIIIIITFSLIYH